MYFNTLAKKRTTNKPQLYKHLQKHSAIFKIKTWHYTTKWGMTHSQNSHNARDFL